MAQATEQITKPQLMAKLKALGRVTKQQRNEVVCALVGHSRIQEYCFGYYTCGRCGEQLGDGLGGVYPSAPKVVIVGHNCKTCRANYAECDWRDKLYAPEPFKKRKES